MLNMEEEQRKRVIDSIPEVGSLDAHKENIQPRRQGRSIGALTTLSSTDRDAILQAGHDQFQELLDSLDEQDDPLQTYISYIDWTIQMYPQVQNLDSNLMGLLKNATDAFKDALQYKTDIRYLKIWIEYARWVEEPLDIFLHLRKKGIGQTLALYYEEYAAYYEKLDKIEEATKVYEAGLKEIAVPFKRLQRNFVLFKERVEEKQKRGLLRKREMEAKVQMESLRATGQRTMLGQKFDSRSRVSVAPNVHAGIESRLHGSHHSAGVRQLGSSSTSTQDNSFSVYVEPSEPSRHQHILPTPSTSASSSTALYITPSSSSRRENQRSIDRFAGSTLPQAPTEPTQPPADTFQVYQDSTQQTPSPPPPHFKRSSSSLSFSTKSESSLGKLRRHPTSDQILDRKRPRLSQHEQHLTERFKKSRHMLFQTTDTKGQSEYIHILKDLNEDMSFEEARARHYGLLDQFKPPKRKEKDGFAKYHERGAAIEPETEYTTETLKAMASIQKIFTVEDTAYIEEEEDLTWNNRYQTFKSLSNHQGSSNSSHHVDENEDS